MPIVTASSAASKVRVLCGSSYQNAWCSYEWHVLQPFDRWLKKSSIEIDRKVPGRLAVNGKSAFYRRLVEKAKG